MKKSTTPYDKLFKTAMSTAIATSAIAVLAPDSTEASTNEEIFTDVKANSYYYEYVNELFERSFVNGYKDGSFKPNGLLTRAEASKILALNLGLDLTQSFNHTFKDVPADSWAYPYISALREAGIINGYQDGTFKPNAPITRNEMAKIIVYGYGLEPAKEITLPFTDVQANNNWAAPYIQTLYNLGITNGQTSKTYGGNSTVTRANMAAFTIRSEKTTDYRENRRPDENVISSIDGNKMTIGGQVYYIKKELQPLLHARNLAVLKEANLDFIKIGTKVVGIRNLELLNGGTGENPLTLDLAGGTVEANLTIAGDYIKLANAKITGDITIKKGDQKQIELNGLELKGRLIIEGEGKRDQESVIKLTKSSIDELVVNRDKTKIVTDQSEPTIKVGNNVSEIEAVGKINTIDFVGNQDVFVKGTLESNKLTIETPIKVTLENKAKLPVVETQKYGSQLIVPKDSTIGTLIKPENVKPEEAVKYPTGGSPTIENVKNIAEVERPTTPTTPTTPPTSGGGSTGGGNNGGTTNPFVSQTLKANNIEDAENKDPLAVGMIGTTVTSSNANVATATLKDGEIIIISKGSGTAIITVKEDAPSLKEAQIIVTVDANGKITHTIKRPIEVVQDKMTATPAPSAEDVVKLLEGINIKGVTPENATDVIAAVKKAISEKGKPLTEGELKLAVDTGLLPSLIKKDNPNLQQVSTPLDLITVGPNGTSFEWKSATKVGDHNASIDLSTGGVTQDKADDENDKVTLKVTATNGNLTKENEINVTILASEQTFESQILTANNIVDAENKDPLAVGMIGTTVTSSNENVATATLKDGEIIITSKGPGTATISVKEDAPSLKEAQIIVTVDADGKIAHTIKRPVEVMQDKITETPAPSVDDVVKLFEGIDIKGITPENATEITEAVKKAIADKGKPLTEDELKLAVDTALLPSLIKKDNPSLRQVSTPLDLVTVGPNGTSFEWKSATKVGDHNATIDLSTGNVTQDDADDENDKLILNVTATNGNASKETSIETTVIESKKPYLVSAILDDKDNDGDTSANDTITFTFSEPIAYAGNPEDIAQQFFGNANAFGDGPIEVAWSEDKTKLTVKIGGSDLSNVFKIDSDITLIANAVKDANGVANEAKTVKLQQIPYEYEIVQNDLSGDFIWENNVVVSEAAGKIKDAITFTRNGKQVDGVEITYAAEDVLEGSGSIESGTFKLKSVNVTKNGKTEKVTFTNGETLNVTTSSVLRVKDGTEVANSVNHTFVQNGLVKTITVDDSVTGTISVPKVFLANPVIIDGKDKLVFNSGLAVTVKQDEVLLKNITVTGGYSGTAQDGERGPVYLSGAADVTLDHVKVDAIGSGGYGASGIILKNANAKLVIKDSNVSTIFAKSDNPAYYACGIRADVAGASIDIINSTISSNGANGVSRVIQTGKGASVNIANSKINAEATTYNGTVYGIYLGEGSSLTMSDASKISVKAPSANGFGIGNNVNYSELNVSDTTLFDIDEAASGKRKAPYEYDPEALAALDKAWAKIDENLIKADNPSLQEVTGALHLPTEVDGISVSWSANTVDGATVNADGTVTRSSNDDEDDTVTLTATLTQNGMTKTKDFQVNIKESKVPTITSATLVDGNADGKATKGESVELTFSEPITFSQLFIGNQEINSELGTWSEDHKKLTITLQDNITATDTITVKANNLEDAAHNSLDVSTVELIVPSAIEAFKISDVNITQNGAEPITITQQGIYKFSVDINLTTNGEGFALDGVYVAQVSGGVLKKIETGTATEKYDTVVDLGGSPYTVVTVTEKVASGKDPALTRNIRYPGTTYKAEVIQPSLIPSPGSQQIASFKVSDVIALEGTNTRNQTVAITIDGTEVEKVITLSNETTDTTLATAIAEAFADVFSGYDITAENSDVIITSKTKSQNVPISAQLK
ncbi:S-layer homology domain-containing protein [Heyndrickxia oleronia]|uniref:S-layer homology domain-containing protein n=1 Tax=Heyndrickxia oleronia TaxID=38875 RepID=UPI003F21A265